MKNRFVKNNLSLYSKAVHGAMMLMDKRISRRVVVFESDDWGSIRMPSLDAFKRLKSQGVVFPDYGYELTDSLASNKDLECLMEVLSSVKDAHGKPAKLTMNCVTSNPDFIKIKENGFREYYSEPFTETLKRYPNHDRSFDLLNKGINEGVFKPQFHGREHLNAQKWMFFLRRNVDAVKKGFNEGLFCMGIPQDSGGYEYVLEAYDINRSDEKDYVKKSINEGLSLFSDLFGFSSESMISPCYLWDDFIEDEAFVKGVRYIQGGYIQKHSRLEKEAGNYISGHFFGEKNRNGQIYLIRNCSFEPSQNKYNDADSCMNDITRAFKLHVPAIVSCHRLNFIGDLDPRNRDNNLKEFKKLLELIVNKYPDVEFLTSDECGHLYE